MVIFKSVLLSSKAENKILAAALPIFQMLCNGAF
jgi:hypothetical protein